MANEELDALLTRMPKIAEAVNAFSSESVQREAFSALVAAFEGRRHLAQGGAASGGEPHGEGAKEVLDSGPSTVGDHGANGMAPAPASPRKTGKKAKTVISMDKSLNLSPQGKQSAAAFAEAKGPSNQEEKCLVAVYYLRDVLGMDKVTAQAVFTFFKTIQWPVPADIRNKLAQSGSKGWLDTADLEDIKVTSLGENVVEHKLPKAIKA